MSTRRELVDVSESRTVLRRVIPPYWPVKQPHGTSRPRMSQVKKRRKSCAAGAAGFLVQAVNVRAAKRRITQPQRENWAMGVRVKACPCT